jgi:chaperone BCS1
MTNMEMVSYWWSVVGFLAFVRGLLPTEAADALHRFLRSILDEYFLPYASFEIPEFEGPSINELYRNVQLHLTAKDLCRGARKTVLCKVKNSTNTTSTLAGNNYE